MTGNDIIRSQLVDGLRQTGADALKAGQIADLAIHAAEQAILVVHRICAPLGGPDGMSAGCIAYQLIEQLARTNAEGLVAQLQALPGVCTTEMAIGKDVPYAAAAGAVQ